MKNEYQNILPAVVKNYHKFKTSWLTYQKASIPFTILLLVTRLKVLDVEEAERVFKRLKLLAKSEDESLREGLKLTRNAYMQSYINHYFPCANTLLDERSMTAEEFSQYKYHAKYS